MERRSGVQCGIIGTQTWTASHLRLVRSSDKNHINLQYCQVKPKKAIVKGVSKKTNKDLGDPAGIFMGEREYIFI
jgi:hypothetical protein